MKWVMGRFGHVKHLKITRYDIMEDNKLACILGTKWRTIGAANHAGC